MPKIFVSEYPDDESRAVAVRLRKLIANSEPHYSLVHSPESAQLILVAAHGNEISVTDYIRSAIKHSVISAFPEKSFSLCFRDHPILFHHGIYESPSSGLWSQGRVAPGFYQLSGTLNPEVRELGLDRPVKKYLASFIGRNSHPCRSRLFAQRFRWHDFIIEDSSSFNMWAERRSYVRSERLQRYGYVLRSSKFALCPRGSGTGSIRLFEALKSGVAPVVIADDRIPPQDPQWHEFCLLLPEKHIDHLEDLLEKEENSSSERGILAYNYYKKLLAPEKYIDYIWHRVNSLNRSKMIPERYFWRFRHVLAIYGLLTYLGNSFTEQIRAIASPPRYH
jgi:hypothetical protein